MDAPMGLVWTATPLGQAQARDLEGTHASNCTGGMPPAVRAPATNKKNGD